MTSDEFTPVVPPSIVKQLEDCNVIEGEAAMFSCCASGNPSPDVSWYRDDERISESRQFTMLVEPDKSTSNMFKYVLVITRSGPDNEGCYICEAANIQGSVKTSAHLYVQCSHFVPEGGEGETDQTDSPVHLPEKPPVEVKKENVEDYFTLLQEMGRGKFGVVHKCVEKSTQKEYAAKVSKCRSASQRKINQNEINILNALNHPLIINIIAAFEFKRQFTMILELVSGGELFERLMEDELISELDVTFYIRQVLRASEYMHNKGILHLDLKPENIMLVAKDSTQIKLIDFSVSCTSHEGQFNKTMCGTRQFNSPELINYDPVSSATDMWAIGVIAYVLLAGYTPFPGETDAEISSNILLCAWSCEDDVFDDISDQAKDFIASLLVKEPKERSTSKECLEHPWLKNIENTKKKLKTAKFVSFIARRNWKKSIAAVQATTSFLRKVTAKCNERAREQAPSAKNDIVIENGYEDEKDEKKFIKAIPRFIISITTTPIISMGNGHNEAKDEYIDVLEITEDVRVKEALLRHL